MIRKGVLLLGCWLAAALPAAAGILNQSVHDSTIDVCFVGDAVTSKTDDIAFIMDHLKIYENYGHLRYKLMANNGRCPAPTQTADGQFDVNAGDLRIGVPATVDFDGTTAITGLALGKGCGDPGTELWWANFPRNLNLPQFRACRLNAFMRKGMAENKILHEIGHSLGLVHEHERTDLSLITEPMVQTCFQDVSYFGKSVTQGLGGMTLLTPYDQDSVMHYEINKTIDPVNVPVASTCNLGNDNGNTGLSAFDQLTIRLLYPHDAKVAEFVGSTVVKTGEPVKLRNEWGLAGAITQNVLKKAAWKVTQGSQVIVQQATADFAFTFATAGDYKVEYTYTDMLNRVYTNVFTLRVLSPQAFRTQIAAPAASALPLM